MLTFCRLRLTPTEEVVAWLKLSVNSAVLPSDTSAAGPVTVSIRALLTVISMLSLSFALCESWLMIVR